MACLTPDMTLLPKSEEPGEKIGIRRTALWRTRRSAATRRRTLSVYDNQLDHIDRPSFVLAHNSCFENELELELQSLQKIVLPHKLCIECVAVGLAGHDFAFPGMKCPRSFRKGPGRFRESAWLGFAAQALADSSQVPLGGA